MSLHIEQIWYSLVHMVVIENPRFFPINESLSSNLRRNDCVYSTNIKIIQSLEYRLSQCNSLLRWEHSMGRSQNLPQQKGYSQQHALNRCSDPDPDLFGSVS